MRRDTQIGVILGMVILVIIGVFLSTRSSFEEADMPVLVLPEESVYAVEEIDIFALAQEAKSEKESLEQEISVEEQVVAEETVDDSAKDPLRYGTLLEGKWKGVVPEPKEKKKELPHTPFAEKESGGDPDLSEDEGFESNETEDLGNVTDSVSEGIKPVVIHTVSSNESLAVLSKKYYGDGANWRVIFEANRDKMSNPDILYVGLELKIPDLNALPVESGSGLSERQFGLRAMDETLETRTYKIHRGDTLHSIASEFYQDGSLWWKIYEANQDTIEDKNILLVGHTLVIPE
ncbi:MAG: LysM peptidoglycan-binding domain-containing protein [Planctomycetes bacterium]|nr:LysM peptidoglycan-binding domain-containing protein [Planctomycetota bacterium]